MAKTTKKKPPPTKAHDITVSSTEEELKIDIEIKGFTANIWVDRKATKVLDEIIQRALPLIMEFARGYQQKTDSVHVPSFSTSEITIPPRLVKLFQAAQQAQEIATKKPTAKNIDAANKATAIYDKAFSAWNKATTKKAAK